MITPGWWAAVTRTECVRFRDCTARARVGATANEAERDIVRRVLDGTRTSGRERERSSVKKWRFRRELVETLRARVY